MKVAVLDDYQDVVRNLNCFSVLKDHQVQVLNGTYSENELVNKLTDIDAIVLIRERTQMTESLLSQLPNLKLISQTGKFSQHIDLNACNKYGVMVVEGIGSPVAPAELCWALIMTASRHIPAYIDQLSKGHWQLSGHLGLGRTLNGLTMGIWGFGKIGRRVAGFANAFGMKVLIWGSDFSCQAAIEEGYEAAESKEAFFSAADVISMHLRLHPSTRGCVTQHDLKLMKADSLFVNISRAELVEPNALANEMNRVKSKRAAVDVYEMEPASHYTEPLLALNNVVCTPHLGYVEKNSYELYFQAAFENIIAFAEGSPVNRVTL